MEIKNVSFGQDENEKFGSGQSSTQQCRSFTFTFGNRLIRLIDTPGLGDTRGNEQDNMNFEDILTYISQYEYLHCICILVKPDQSRLTSFFQYVIDQLLSHLQLSASNNIVFVYTHSRSCSYSPGETGGILKTILDQIKVKQPQVNIKLNKNTMYCLDNEAFRFLVALKQGRFSI